MFEMVYHVVKAIRKYHVSLFQPCNLALITVKLCWYLNQCYSVSFHSQVNQPVLTGELYLPFSLFPCSYGFVNKPSSSLFHLFAFSGKSFSDTLKSQKPRHLQYGEIQQAEFSSKCAEVFDNAAWSGGKKGAALGTLHIGRRYS